MVLLKWNLGKLSLQINWYSTLGKKSKVEFLMDSLLLLFSQLFKAKNALGSSELGRLDGAMFKNSDLDFGYLHSDARTSPNFCHWTIYLTSLALNFFIFRMTAIIMNNASEIRWGNTSQTHKARSTKHSQLLAIILTNLAYHLTRFSKNVLYCTVVHFIYILNSFLKYVEYITLMEKVLATETNRPGFGFLTLRDLDKHI